MWICANNGFFSIVAVQPHDWTRYRAELKAAGKPMPKQAGRDHLCVRSRDAKALAKAFPDAHVSTWPARDYPARVFLTRERVAAEMASSVAGIGYTNFKSSVKDHALHDAYMDIWTIMFRYQHGHYDPKRPAKRGKRKGRAGMDEPWLPIEADSGRLPHWSDTLDPYGDEGDALRDLDYTPRSAYGMNRQ